MPNEHQGISYQNLDIFALLKTCYLEGAPSLFTKEMLDTNKSLEKLCQSNIQDKITPIQLMIRFILIKHELPLEENIGLINPNFARILVDNNLYNKTILQQALHSSNLQAAVIAVNNPKISFAENWIQLQENIYLQKAAIALYNADIDFSKDGNWLKLKENTNLQKALAIAYDYLNYNNFISKSKQELYAEKQTLQLIQNLIAKKNNSLDMIRTEMQQWVSGYAPPAIQSSIDTPSPANIDHPPQAIW
ncbi:hypothetical protein AVM71_03885 [Piscirickettsia salmonis]|nr:hypothetical protein AVM71_03885 [Piscirickettsia salmonis]